MRRLRLWAAQNILSAVAVKALVGSAFIGFDLGTSGARIAVVDSSLQEIFSDSIQWKAFDDPKAWEEAVHHLLGGAATSVDLGKVKSICVSGTSASCLTVDRTGQMRRTPRMYNYDVMASSTSTKFAERAMNLMDQYAPPKHTVRAKTSSLAKLLTWVMEETPPEGEALCHQADYVMMKMMAETGRSSIISSDWHNCLKCGYDVEALEWPSWIKECLKAGGASPDILPQNVVSPGDPIGTISSTFSSDFNLANDTVLVGGTTDSNAAFFAAVGGTNAEFGTAVTSLGSTLAIKQLSQTFVEDSERGVYSHRFPSKTAQAKWLIGGASNVGCAILRQEQFSDEELEELSQQIDPAEDISLSYYPLTKPGERFPVADGRKLPILEPIPESRVDYLKGILQGISEVERDGFKVLKLLGADQPTTVYTSGGGSKNDIWSAMRQRKLAEEFADDSILVKRAENVDASFGAAVLAASNFVERN